MPYGTLAADTIQSSTSGTPPQFNDGNGTQVGTLCRAWVNFNGASPVAIRASFNISSVTRNSTGNYTIAFANALPDANYGFISTNRNTTTANSRGLGSVLSRTASAVQFETVYVSSTGGSGVQIDDPQIDVAIFR